MTDKVVREGIKTMCQGTDWVKKARIQTLKVEFKSLSMKDSKLLDVLCIIMNELVTNIRAAGVEIEEAYTVMKLLRAVPSKFLQIASTILETLKQYWTNKLLGH